MKASTEKKVRKNRSKYYLEFPPVENSATGKPFTFDEIFQAAITTNVRDLPNYKEVQKMKTING